MRQIRRTVRGGYVEEDVAVEAFTELWRLLERQPVADPRALLYKIAERKAIDAGRRRARRAEKEQPVGLVAELAAIEEAELALGRSLPHALASFPAEHDQAVRDLAGPERDAYILTDLRGLTVREAADVLDVPRSTVGDRRLAARTFIREEIAA